MSSHGLSHEQLEVIKTILRPYADHIDQVGLFGSRATGAYRPNSDIDMVIYGSLSESDINRIWTLFDTSTLPIKVDLQAYPLIPYPPLREHIDKVMCVLFTKNDLY